MYRETRQTNAKTQTNPLDVAVAVPLPLQPLDENYHSIRFARTKTYSTNYWRDKWYTWKVRRVRALTK